MNKIIQDYQTCLSKLDKLKQQYSVVLNHGHLCDTVLEHIKLIETSEQEVLNLYECKDKKKFVNKAEVVVNTYRADISEFMLMHNDLVATIPALYDEFKTLNLKPITEEGLLKGNAFYERAWLMDMVDTLANTELYGRVCRVITAMTKEESDSSVFNELGEDFDTLGYSLEEFEFNIPEDLLIEANVAEANWDKADTFNLFKSSIESISSWVDSYNNNATHGDSTAVAHAVGCGVKNTIENGSITPNKYISVLFDHMIDMAENTIKIPMRYMKCRLD